MTFEEMAAQRDPLYAATKPQGAFLFALDSEKEIYSARTEQEKMTAAFLFIGALYDLAIRALRNETL